MKKCISILCAMLILCGCSIQRPTDIPEASLSPTHASTSATETMVPSQSTLSPSESAPGSEPDPVLEILERMTIEEKVGQLFLARCPETGAAEDIQKYHLGGFVLFGRDFKNETVYSVTDTIQSYQAVATIPMLIAVDEEGGTVTRVSRYPAFRSEPFQSPRRLYALGGLDLILETEAEKCQLLTSLGINVNIGPVCDITTDRNAFMYDRSLGEAPEIAANFVQTMVAKMGEYHVGSVLKHFPGYGNNTDTHTGIAVDNRSLAELESCDLIPFAAGIDAGCGAIMVSHVFINAIDTELPATLSPTVHTYLRDTMGFDGVIITDDLAMEAITGTYGAGEAAVLAVLAGNDLLCVTDYAEQYKAVLQAVKDGRISETLLDNAIYRILRWKAELQLF